MGSRIEAINHPLDLDERINLRSKGWIVQIIGKILILSLVVMGLLGVFGDGWASKKTAQAGGAQVIYQRFLRHEAHTRMHIGMTGVQGYSAISFPLNYIRSMEISAINPQPERSFIRDGQVWYVFEAEQNLMATFDMRPRIRGNLHGSVWINEARIPLHHLIYP